MMCAFCRILLDEQKHGECALIAPNGNGIVARLCNDCLMEMGRFLDLLVKGGFKALENAADATDENQTVPLFVPPSVWKQQTMGAENGGQKTKRRQGQGV